MLGSNKVCENSYQIADNFELSSSNGVQGGTLENYEQTEKLSSAFRATLRASFTPNRQPYSLGCG